MYVSPNYKTKKALKTALANGEQVTVLNNSPFPSASSGEVTVEGPHYPAPHTWYGRVLVRDGIVVKVIS